MKDLFVKSILICVLFFLYASFVYAQDTEFQEQVEVDTLQIYIRNAQYRQAVEFIDRMEPTKELLYQKALCFRYLNTHSNAIEILTALLEETPDDIPVLLQLASCYEAVSKYSKSFDCYDNLLRIDSTNTYFEVRKADLLYRSEKYALALDAYNRIDTIYNPNYITRCIAMCYEKLNQQGIAKNYFNDAWYLNESDVYSANSLVKIQVKEEDYLSAFVNSEKFIATDSTNATMNVLNAFVYYNLDYYDEAIERFEKCLQKGDSSLLVNRSLGYSYYLTGKDSLAHIFLQQATLQDTLNTNLLYVLGKVNYKLGYYPESVNCFLKILTIITPSDTELYGANKGLALAYEKTGEFNRAVGAYQATLRFVTSNQEKMELLYTMATIADKELKQYFAAVSYYEQYRLCLFNYQNSLKDEKDIDEIEEKLTALDEYIKFLKSENEKLIRSRNQN